MGSQYGQDRFWWTSKNELLDTGEYIHPGFLYQPQIRKKYNLGEGEPDEIYESAIKKGWIRLIKEGPTLYISGLGEEIESDKLEIIQAIHNTLRESYGPYTVEVKTIVVEAIKAKAAYELSGGIQVFRKDVTSSGEYSLDEFLEEDVSVGRRKIREMAFRGRGWWDDRPGHREAALKRRGFLWRK